MGRMASWKDGAAYAPVERPDGFATPRVDPLEVATPYQATTPAAVPRPTTFNAQPQPPLQQLGTGEVVRRDPSTSFAVSSMLLANSPGALGPRDPKTPFITSATANAAPPASPGFAAPPPQALGFLPPSGAALPPPGMPLPPPTGMPLPPPPGMPLPPPTGAPSPYPAAWTPWPTQPLTPPSPADSTIRTISIVAAGIAFLGVLAPSTAPITLLAAGGLGVRTREKTGQLCWIALIIGLTAIMVQLLLGALNSPNVIWVLSALGITVAYLALGLRTSRR